MHLAIQDWTKSVDQKASIFLVFNTVLATLAGREVFNVHGGLHHTSGTTLWVVRVMASCFAMSALLAISVVLPRLRRRATRTDAAHGLVYFGHLRHRTVDDIERRLHGLDDDEVLAQLARQLKATAVIAWRKHVRLQAAMIALVIAASSFGFARLL